MKGFWKEIAEYELKAKQEFYWIDSVKNVILPAIFGVDPNTEFLSLFPGLKHLNGRSSYQECTDMFSSLVVEASRTLNSN
jgi:hypothetical protein